MAEVSCYVTIVFKGNAPSTSVWMKRATLEQLTADFKNASPLHTSRKVYELTPEAATTNTATMLAVELNDVLYIA